METLIRALSNLEAHMGPAASMWKPKADPLEIFLGRDQQKRSPLAPVGSHWRCWLPLGSIWTRSPKQQTLGALSNDLFWLVPASQMKLLQLSTWATISKPAFNPKAGNLSLRTSHFKLLVIELDGSKNW